MAKYKKIARNIIDDENKPGIEPKTINIENDLISYIKLCRGLEIAKGTNEIIMKAYELIPALRELNYNGIHTWVRRFLKRYNYTLMMLQLKIMQVKWLPIFFYIAVNF